MPLAFYALTNDDALVEETQYAVISLIILGLDRQKYNAPTDTFGRLEEFWFSMFTGGYTEKTQTKSIPSISQRLSGFTALRELLSADPSVIKDVRCVAPFQRETSVITGLSPTSDDPIVDTM